jgi:hypothetical protein
MKIEKKDKKLVINFKDGIGFGCALAMILSYTLNHSILWAILHGIFGWFYVIYFAIVH